VCDPGSVGAFAPVSASLLAVLILTHDLGLHRSKPEAGVEPATEFPPITAGLAGAFTNSATLADGWCYSKYGMRSQGHPVEK
jgi:hypothetical protein